VNQQEQQERVRALEAFGIDLRTFFWQERLLTEASCGWTFRRTSRRSSSRDRFRPRWSSPEGKPLLGFSGAKR
jgi:hypothetical protein